MIPNYQNIVYELQKLYPEVKIPVRALAPYYLDQLRESRQYHDLDKKIHDVVDLLKEHGQESKKGDLEARDHKMRFVGKIKTLFEQRGWTDKINKRYPGREEIWQQEFKPQEDTMYISIDLREANFSTLNQLLDLGASSWLDFVEQHFPDMHLALRKSKSYRQLLFGNLNPNRVIGFTRQYTCDYAEMVKRAGFKLVGVSTDELIIEEDGEGADSLFEAVQKLHKLPWLPKLPVKLTPFSVEFKSDGPQNQVRVDTVIVLGDLDGHLIFTNSYQRLHGVAANRFYHNFALHILGEQVGYEDKLFEVEGRVAQWV
jgi:hypothetical protein